MTTEPSSTSIPMPAQPAAILWDFDNTLVETEHHWMSSEVAVSDRLGGTWTLEQAQEFCGKPTHDLADAMVANIGDPTLSPDDVFAQVVDEVVATTADAGDVFLPGALEILAQLRALGMPMALVTSSPRAVLAPILAQFPEGTFDYTLAGDELLPNKPAPDPYLKAAEVLGVDASQCLVLEDSPTGVAAGNAAGAVVIALPKLGPVDHAPRRIRLKSLAGIGPHDLFALYRQGVSGESGLSLSGVRTGPLQPGERVTLTDPKGRRHSVILQPGKVFHTTKGGIKHEDLLGGPDAVVVTSAGGMQFLAMRPLMSEFTVTMPREAAVIYPKDAAQILMWTDIFPGARVLEAGVGSGALSIALLRAIGAAGRLHSYERRDDFAAVAQRNVESFLGGTHPAWELTVGDLVEAISDEPIDRAILDMLAPWECIDAVGERLVPGGVLTCYVATTTQMGRTMDTLRAHGGFTEPHATETTIRAWHAEGLAIRPAHSTTGHTGFLVISRRLAPGVTAPMRKRRPAPGAYGPDYSGPRPANIPESNIK